MNFATITKTKYIMTFTGFPQEEQTTHCTHSGSGVSSLHPESLATQQPHLLLPYTIKMSSKYASCGNSVYNLNELDGFAGVCTDKDDEAYVEVLFANCVTVHRTNWLKLAVATPTPSAAVSFPQTTPIARVARCHNP